MHANYAGVNEPLGCFFAVVGDITNAINKAGRLGQ